MPLFGFARARDVDTLASRVDALQTSVDAMSDTLGSRVDELKASVGEDLRTLVNDVDALSETTSALQTCTPLMTGVHLCRAPMYDTVQSVRETVPKTLMNRTDDFCIKIDTLADFPFLRDSDDNKTMDIPNSYVCVEGAALNQYTDAFIPPSIKTYIADTGDSWNFSLPRCNVQCRHYTCDQIRNGEHISGLSRYVNDNNPAVLCGKCKAPGFKCRPYA